MKNGMPVGSCSWPENTPGDICGIPISRFHVRAITRVTSGLVVMRTSSIPPLCRTRSLTAISAMRGALLAAGGGGATMYVKGFGVPDGCGCGVGDGVGGTGVVVAAGVGADVAGVAMGGGAGGGAFGCGWGGGARATSDGTREI